MLVPVGDGIPGFLGMAAGELVQWAQAFTMRVRQLIWSLELKALEDVVAPEGSTILRFPHIANILAA